MGLDGKENWEGKQKKNFFKLPTKASSCISLKKANLVPSKIRTAVS